MQDLEKRGLVIEVSFWAFDPVLEVYRLIIAVGPDEFESPIETYRVIQDAIKENDLGITLSRVSIIRGDDPKIDNLRQLAQSDTRDVIEAPMGRIEIADRMLDDVRVYRQDALRYERAVFEALQRVQPRNAILRNAYRLDLPRHLRLDFLLDDGKVVIIVEAKALSSPLGTREIRAAEATLYDAAEFFHRPVAIIVVSKSGFTERALESASYRNGMRLVNWAGPADDKSLRIAVDEFFSYPK
jgi:hypothetical protein